MKKISAQRLGLILNLVVGYLISGQGSAMAFEGPYADCEYQRKLCQQSCQCDFGKCQEWAFERIQNDCCKEAGGAIEESDATYWYNKYGETVRKNNPIYMRVLRQNPKAWYQCSLKDRECSANMSASCALREMGKDAFWATGKCLTDLGVCEASCNVGYWACRAEVDKKAAHGN